MIFFSVLSYGQTYKQYIKAGNKSLEEKDYYSAMRYYQEALEIKEGNAEIYYKCANAARLFFAFTTAEEYYIKTQKLSQNNEFPLLPFYLAEVKQTLGKYEEAIKLYDQFLKSEVGNQQDILQAEKEKKSCEWAKESSPNEKIKVERLSNKINTKFSEFAGVWMSDTLIFASLKYKDESVPEDRRIAKTLLSTNTETQRGKTVRIKELPENINVANATFDVENNKMFFTVCEYINTMDLHCEIYYAIWDGRKWLAEKLSETINNGNNNTQPAWSSHKNWKGLFFSSDREGGKGGLDIWFAQHLGGDEFAEPINLEEINTPYDEITPSVDNTSETVDLYFSSNGYLGFGNYDVYKTQHNQETWEHAMNMKTPINSSYNDVYFWKDSRMNKAIVSSNRPESASMLKKTPACCNDLYNVIMPIDEEEIVVIEEPQPILVPEPKPEPVPVPEPQPQPKPEPIPVLTPTPTPTPIPQPAPPVTTSIVTFESILPVKVYFDNDEPDKRTLKTRTQKPYSQAYNEYIARENTFYDKYAAVLPSDKKYIAMNSLSDFFNNHVRKGYSDLQLLSTMVLDKLVQGKTVTIEVKGFTSPRARTAYNDKLAQRRTSSLLNYFNEYQGGIFLPYLQSGKMKIVELPIGEITAPAGISDSIPDERNSIYSPEASLERRAEVVAIKIK